jgi:hypothetical protein
MCIKILFFEKKVLSIENEDGLLCKINENLQFRAFNWSSHPASCSCFGFNIKT